MTLLRFQWVVNAPVGDASLLEDEAGSGVDNGAASVECDEDARDCSAGRTSCELNSTMNSLMKSSVSASIAGAAGAAAEGLASGE